MSKELEIPWLEAHPSLRIIHHEIDGSQLEVTVEGSPPDIRAFESQMLAGRTTAVLGGALVSLRGMRSRTAKNTVVTVTATMSR